MINAWGHMMWREVAIILWYLVAVSFWTQAKKEPVDLTTLKAHCDFYFLGTLSITNYLVDTYQFQRKFKGLIIYSPTMSNGYYIEKNEFSQRHY